jgi:hypothetical protein
MARAQVTLSKEALEDLALRNRPVTVGLLLAPVGAALGTLAMVVMLFLASHQMHARIPQLGPWSVTVWWSLAKLYLVFGMLLGTLLAWPVTGILFPILHGMRVPRPVYPVAGLIAGMLIGAIWTALAPSALFGGVVTGLLFMLIVRPRSKAPHTLAEPDLSKGCPPAAP